jgi:PAS domain-containing protein
VSFVNPALATAWGAPPPRILGRPIDDFVCLPGDDVALAAVLTQAEEQGRWKGQLRPRRADGTGDRFPDL